MAFEHTKIIEVRYGNQTVGAASLGEHFPQFQYSDSWIKQGKELAPFLMPISGGARVYEFSRLRSETFFLLPPMLADSLPDYFGNQLINEWMRKEGVALADITPLDRLTYIGQRGMGKLTFWPDNSPQYAPSMIDLAQLTVAAREAVIGSINVSGNDSDEKQTQESLQLVLQVGTSAGGARPKAVLNINDETGEFFSGALAPKPGESSWLLKFDGVTDDRTLATSKQYTRLEYAYYLMATAAGIEMAETKLLHEGGRAHFLTRRFDRQGENTRVHMSTLCGLQALDNDLIGVNDYAQLFSTINELGLPEQARVEAFRRMVFNVAAVNHDDHTKNHSFLMDDHGKWHLSPAYDLSYANVPGHPYMQQHCMGVEGEFKLITPEKMMRAADRFAIPFAKREMQRVFDVVDSWGEFAALAGVPSDHAEQVALAHRTLGRGIAP